MEENSKRPKQRGAQDEFEALRLVITSNPGLQGRVLNKIREHLKLSKGSLFEEMKDKQVQPELLKKKA
jgi:hypothetical protein